MDKTNIKTAYTLTFRAKYDAQLQAYIELYCSRPRPAVVLAAYAAYEWLDEGMRQAANELTLTEVRECLSKV